MKRNAGERNAAGKPKAGGKVINFLTAYVARMDRWSDAIGRAISWLTLAMVLVTFAVVILRYVFSIGWVWLQESYVWMHAVVFMVGAGYTLLEDAHVRVDIFYRPAGVRYKALVNLLGGIFLLLPMLFLVAFVAWGYVADSWLRLEESREAGGLPGLFLLKSVILAFCLLLGAQGLALAARSFLILRGAWDGPPTGQGRADEQEVSP
jgi:TRAP-type mannitol/chloroaromatic compound transport system permease small subunit